jgi:hypothetical protein
LWTSKEFGCLIAIVTNRFNDHTPLAYRIVRDAVTQGCAGGFAVPLALGFVI